MWLDVRLVLCIVKFLNLFKIFVKSLELVLNTLVGIMYTHTI